MKLRIQTLRPFALEVVLVERLIEMADRFRIAKHKIESAYAYLCWDEKAHAMGRELLKVVTELSDRADKAVLAEHEEWKAEAARRLKEFEDAEKAAGLDDQ